MSEAADLETAFPSKGQAGADPYSIPLEKIDVTDSELWSTDTHWGYFERLRSEAPVHYCADSEFGRYWSVTTFDHIVEVEKDPETYSSEPTITVGDIPEDSVTQNAGFITMDGPRHTAHRKVAQPVSSPRNIKALEPIVRERSIAILDSLPIGETFDWVDKVSIELTTAMLATMFDFDWETRRKLTYWSDMATISDEQLAEEGCSGGAKGGGRHRKTSRAGRRLNAAARARQNSLVNAQEWGEVTSAEAYDAFHLIARRTTFAERSPEWRTL